MKKLSGEYEEKGEYHRRLDKNWPYYPVYVEKMKLVKKILKEKGKNKKILDVGCGEGVLVEELSKGSFDAIGLDLNYSSKYVKKGSIFKMPFKNESFGVVLCLDVLEHLNLMEQENAIKEIRRVSKKGALIVISVPNLAHFASRISFLFLGKLLRTSQIERHIGDRPYGEYLKIISNHLKILSLKGLFPTFPIISFLTLKMPSRILWMHKLYNKLFGWLPGICFQSIFICKKLG